MVTPASPEEKAPAIDPFDADQSVHMDDVFGFSSATPPDLDGAEAGEPAVGAADGEGGDEGKASPPEPTPPAAAPAEKPTPAAPLSDQELELESLRNQVAELTKKTETPPGPPEPVAEEPPKPENTIPAPEPISIKLPDGMKNAIFGESLEEAGAAMDQLVSHIYTQVNMNFHTLLSSLPQIIQSELAKAQGGTVSSTPESSTPPPADETRAKLEQARADYFADFPQHNKPEIQPVIAAVAQEMAVQFPGAKWDQRYRASLGSRVTERLKQLAALTNPSHAPAPSLPSGPRSAGPALGDVDISDEILETLRG